MKGIILHGGHGTRLRPLTHTGPKQLLPIANKPMSEYCLNSIKETGITEIAIIIGGLGSKKVIDYYGSGEKFGVKITYIEQDEPKGIAHAVDLCKDFIGKDKFLVFLGDNIIQKSILEYRKNFEDAESDATLLLCEVENPSRFGIADVLDGNIKKITEKPKNPTSNLAVTGIYFLTPKIFDVIKNLEPSWRNELEITDALQKLLENNCKISYEIITDYWKDTGTPEDIINANSQILADSKERKIGQGTVIEKGAKIHENSIIGKNCKISDGVIIGPNTSIGDNVIIENIDKSSLIDIENSIIMSDCLIKGSITIRHSIISSKCSIKRNENGPEDKILLLGEGTQISV